MATAKRKPWEPKGKVECELCWDECGSEACLRAAHGKKAKGQDDPVACQEAEKAVLTQIASQLGLTLDEKVVLENLAKAYNVFCTLEASHSDEKEEFRAAIHQAQYLVARRVACRADPEIWT